jgi:hypothetical protein
MRADGHVEKDTLTVSGRAISGTINSKTDLLVDTINVAMNLSQ